MDLKIQSNSGDRGADAMVILTYSQGNSDGTQDTSTYITHGGNSSKIGMIGGYRVGVGGKAEVGGEDGKDGHTGFSSPGGAGGTIPVLSSNCTLGSGYTILTTVGAGGKGGDGSAVSGGSAYGSPGSVGQIIALFYE